MDILKVLSRGTKRVPNKPSSTVDSKSATRPTNPQLYGGLKRKREEEQPRLDENKTSKGQEDFDFFALPKPEKPTHDTAREQPPKQECETPLLDEQQVRQILKTHRLKFTLLSSHDERRTKVKKSKKKDTTKSKAKDSKKQLFPQPLTAFSELRTAYNVSARLADNIAKQGYRIPTEVQLGSLPLLLHPEKAIPPAAASEMNIATDDGIHFLGVSPTGSGKTLNFLIPTINSLLRRRAGDADQKAHVLESIIIAPTRELVHQIVNEGRKLTQGLGIRIVGMKKGMKIPAEGQPVDVPDFQTESGSESEDDSSSNDEEKSWTAKRATTTKPDILVATPRLLQMFLRSRTLPTVRSLVLDEGDVILSDLFLDQVLSIWSACTHQSLRLTCWSATMGSHIEELVLKQVQSRDPPGQPVPLIRLVVGLKDTAVPRINHKLVYTATEQGKLFALRQIFHPKSSDDSMPPMRLPLLVFTQSIERATALYDELKFDVPAEAGGSTRIAALHSSLSDSARSGIVSRFRAGEIWFLITTDLLMRGMDFRGVNGVINYDIPTSAAAYVHRVGRTGRAGESGNAVTFYTQDDVVHLKTIANVIALSEKQAGKEGDEGVPKWLIDSLPKVSKEEKKNLKERGVESRRGTKAKITSQSAWERRKENNKRGAIEGSKKRKMQGTADNARGGGRNESEWSGIDD
ncbi:Uu.00g028620.m01.CDS01 [Anthostomella pinea]|uniref:RNA helicase n=1 Tax=Anthostomella pinea TaxID=933095 RepID=A0AAI8YAE5_9PEZI|nr:Uu.00g028620.m01.CDS01 [Anthostomella pinea]